MLLPCYAPVRPTDKIEAWRQEVGRQTLGSQESGGDEACGIYPGHGMTLQSTTLRATAAAPPLDRSRRSALAEISLPNHPTKRKASNLTSDSKRKRQKTAVQGATKRKMPKSNPPKTESSKGKGIAPDEKDYAPNGHGELAQGRRGRKNNANPQKSSFNIRCLQSN